MPRAIDPQISFADLEFSRQGVRLDPTLQRISDFLGDHAELVERVPRTSSEVSRTPTPGEAA